ncbi:MAG: serine kinase [Candidatus Aminicenantes bacterium]|nr:MAG: serine kinase [Candidatus Aminicenantes bacterium]
MKLIDIVKTLELDVKAGHNFLNRKVTGGYVSDILSSVLTHAEQGNIWVTYQRHLNIVPIAGAKEISGIIVVSGREVDQETLEKADEEKMPILGTSMDAFQVVGKLYRMGIRGIGDNV